MSHFRVPDTYFVKFRTDEKRGFRSFALENRPLRITFLQTMKTPLLAVSLLFAIAAARADFVIEQKVDGLGQQSGNITVKIKEARARAELSPQISYIIDGVSGDSITLMHAQKSFMKVSAEQGKALMEQMRKKDGGDGKQTKPAASGQKETVNEWQAEIFTWSSGSLAVRYWVARDFPNAAAIQTAMDKARAGGLGALNKNLLPANSDFPGMVVKTEMKTKGKVVTSTIVSVKEEPVDEKVFAVPADYKELPTPAFDAATSP